MNTIKQWFSFNSLFNGSLINKNSVNLNKLSELYIQKIQLFIHEYKFPQLNAFLNQIKGEPVVKKLVKYNFDLEQFNGKENPHFADRIASYFSLIEMGLFNRKNDFLHYNGIKFNYSKLYTVVSPYEIALLYLTNEPDKEKLIKYSEIFLNQVRADKRINYHNALYLAEAKRLEGEIYLESFYGDLESICLKKTISKNTKQHQKNLL